MLRLYAVLEDLKISRRRKLSVRHSRSAPLHPAAGGWAGVGICLGLSLLLAGLSTPLVRGLWSQVQAMDPRGDRPADRQAHDAARAALQADRRLSAVRSALAAVAAHGLSGAADEAGTSPPDPPDLTPHRQADPGNGLYDWLDLLPLMRAAGPGRSPYHPDAAPALQDPSPDAAAAAVIERLQRLPPEPPRLYHARQRQIAERALRAARGIPRDEPDRRSAAEAHRFVLTYSGDHRPVVRELVRGLVEHAADWRAAGRPAEAKAAARAAASLLLDLLDDSATPDVALLAAELLPRVLGELESPDAAATAANAAAAFADRWYEVSRQRQVNLVPWTGDTAWAPAAHRRLMRSLVASGVVIAAWLTLAAACLVLLPPALLAARRRGTLASGGLQPIPAGGPLLPLPGGPGFSLMVASLAFCLPFILLVGLVFASDMSFTWLFSSRSLPAVILVPALVPVMLGLATRLYLRSQPASPSSPGETPSPHHGPFSGRPPRRPVKRSSGGQARAPHQAAGPAGGMHVPQQPPVQKRPAVLMIAVGLALALVLALLLLLTGRQAPWAPPLHILLIRYGGAALGIALALLAAAWIFLGWLHRRRAGLPPGHLARTNLHVAAGGLLLLSLLTLVVLVANHRADQRHQHAFTRAAAEPLTDRLGPDWRQNHFDPARHLLDSATTDFHRPHPGNV